MAWSRNAGRRRTRGCLGPSRRPPRPVTRRASAAAAAAVLAAPPVWRGHDAVTEELEGVACALVRGELPAAFPAGDVLRNGPNNRFPPLPGGRATHPFEGDGLVHRLRFPGGGGAPTYGCRFVRTPELEAEERAGRSLFAGVGFAMGPQLAVNVASNLAAGAAHLGAFTPQKAVSNTSVLLHAGRLLSLNEAHAPVELDRETLRTKGSPPFAAALRAGMCAHSKVCPRTGELVMHGIVYAGPSGPGIDYGVLDRRGERFVTRTWVPMRRACVMHDFAVTPRYSVFLDTPLTFSTERMVAGERLIAFDAESGGTRFGVLPRHGGAGDMRWVEVAGTPFHVFHLMNAWEDERAGELVLVGCRMEDADLDPDGDGQLAGGSSDLGYLHEWRVCTRTWALASERRLHDVGSDLPRVNDALVGQEVRYGWSVRFAEAASRAASKPVFDVLIKHDLSTGTTLEYDPGRSRFCGECVFVPAPRREREDDGWVVTLVYDAGADASEAVVVDARTMEEAAAFAAPRRIPFGFHGAWLPGRTPTPRGRGP